MKPTYALLLSLLVALSAAAQPPTVVPSANTRVPEAAETRVPESAAPLTPGPWTALPPEVREIIPPEEWLDILPDGVEQRPFEGWRLPSLGGETLAPWRHGSPQRPAGAWQQRQLFQTQSAERARQQVSILLQPMPARIGQTEWKRSAGALQISISSHSGGWAGGSLDARTLMFPAPRGMRPHHGSENGRLSNKGVRLR